MKAGVETAPQQLLTLACTAARAVRLVRPESGERVAVVGPGALGDLVAAGLAAAGVRDVRRADGAVFEPMPDVAIDTTGDPAVIVSLLERVPRSARVVLLGTSRGRTAEVDFYRTVHQRGLVLMGVSAPADPATSPDLEEARRLLARSGLEAPSGHPA